MRRRETAGRCKRCTTTTAAWRPVSDVAPVYITTTTITTTPKHSVIAAVIVLAICSSGTESLRAKRWLACEHRGFTPAPTLQVLLRAHVLASRCILLYEYHAPVTLFCTTRYGALLCTCVCLLFLPFSSFFSFRFIIFAHIFSPLPINSRNERSGVRKQTLPPPPNYGSRLGRHFYRARRQRPFLPSSTRVQFKSAYIHATMMDALSSWFRFFSFFFFFASKTQNFDPPWDLNSQHQLLVAREGTTT